MYQAVLESDIERNSKEEAIGQSASADSKARVQSKGATPRRKSSTRNSLKSQAKGHPAQVLSRVEPSKCGVHSDSKLLSRPNLSVTAEKSRSSIAIQGFSDRDHDSPSFDLQTRLRSLDMGYQLTGPSSEDEPRQSSQTRRPQHQPLWQLVTQQPIKPANPPTSMTPSHGFRPDGREIKEGYLSMRGELSGKWKTKFFVLDNSILRYYASPVGILLGTIRLQGAQICKVTTEHQPDSPSTLVGADNDFGYALTIVEAKGQYTSKYFSHMLRAESDVERGQWLAALMQYLDLPPDPERQARLGFPRNPSSQNKLSTLESNARADKEEEAKLDIAGNDEAISSNWPGHENAVPAEPLINIVPIPPTTSLQNEQNIFSPTEQAAKPISGFSNGDVTWNLAEWANKPLYDPKRRGQEQQQKNRDIGNFQERPGTALRKPIVGHRQSLVRDLMTASQPRSSEDENHLEHSDSADGTKETGMKILRTTPLFHTADLNLNALAKAIQSDRGCSLIDRRGHSPLCHTSFTGSKLTTWLLNNFQDIATREEAVALGDRLMFQGLFRHVKWKHEFKDGNSIYSLHEQFTLSKVNSWSDGLQSRSSHTNQDEDSEHAIDDSSVYSIQDRVEIGTTFTDEDFQGEATLLGTTIQGLAGEKIKPHDSKSSVPKTVVEAGDIKNDKPRLDEVGSIIETKDSPNSNHIHRPNLESGTLDSPAAFSDIPSSRPSALDCLKVSVENFVGQQLLWWPFKEPTRPVARDMRRRGWHCDCGKVVVFDVPLSACAAGNPSRLPLTEVAPATPTHDSLAPPPHNQSSFTPTATSSPSPHVQLTYGSQPTPLPCESNSTGQTPPGRLVNSALPNSLLQVTGQFIYWCISIGMIHAQVVELDVLHQTDESFTAQLLKEYSMVTGWWEQFWTMSSCCGASFRKFRYLYDDRNVVSCGREPELPNDPQYHYTKRDPLCEHLYWLEARIAHHLHDHTGVKWPWSAGHPPMHHPMSALTSLLQHIPKKVPQRLEAREFNVGYGMQAVANMAVGRVMVLFLVWHSTAVAVMIWWLVRHHGDLQNAFAMLGTALAGFMIYLDILLRFRR